MPPRWDWTTEEGRRLVFGLLLIVGGIVLFLNRLDIFHVFGLWPLIVVAVGAVKMVGACCAKRRRDGAWVLVFGLWFSLNEFTAASYRDTWPLILVAVGGMMVWDAIAAPAMCLRCAGGRHDD